VRSAESGFKIFAGTAAGEEASLLEELTPDG